MEHCKMLLYIDALLFTLHVLLDALQVLDQRTSPVPTSHPGAFLYVEPLIQS
jgi:hypothetical protein